MTAVSADPAQGAPPRCSSCRGPRTPAGAPADGLTAVNALIAARVDHDDAFIAEGGRAPHGRRGKRFRPLLTLLAAEFGTARRAGVAAAAGVEPTHLASLYHDDVMDEADVRRGAPSANAV